MSGSQHNPNGRQSQLGSGWSPLQLQMANLLARAPQAHMASDRGVTWHTPTPPPHLYHVPAPSPPDPLQAMKGAGGNSVFRHTATPPELYRHTPTPPDKHLMRHTPSPGDVKAGAPIPPDLYPHLGPARDKLVREEMLGYARVGVDLSLGSRANGAPALPPHSPALSVRDAPTINSLLGRGGARRVDSLLERLAPAPAPPSPHSVIVHPRAPPTPSPPSSNEDSADSCGAPAGSKRKRKPERTVRVGAPPQPAAPAPAPAPPASPAPAPAPAPPSPPSPPSPRDSPPPATIIPCDPPSAAEAGGAPARPAPAENGDVPALGPAPPAPPPPPLDTDTGRRKTRSGSAETIAEIAAMVAGAAPPPAAAAPPAPALSVDKLKSVLASPEPEREPGPEPDDCLGEGAACVAPRRLGPRGSDSPSEGRPAEGACAEPAAACFVEVENQLEKMFAGLEEPAAAKESSKAKARRKSTAARRKAARKKPDARARRRDKDAREGYDSGSNASSGRSRGPYIQIRGPRASPASVCVMNAATGEEEEGGARRARGAGAERRRGLHASTLGLRYDAATRDATWVCAFCQRGPHARGLGDLFGPYALEEGGEAWLHADCGVWAPGVLAAGARVRGLGAAVRAAAGARCRHCARAAGPLACAARACPARAHLPCARRHAWRLDEGDFRALCPRHRPHD